MTTAVVERSHPVTTSEARPSGERRAARSRILFVSICPRVSEQVRRLAKDLDLAIEIFEGGMTKGGLQYAIEHQHDYDVIVSQGGTAAHIESCITSIPVITIKLSITDFLDAFERAIERDRPLALFCVNSEVLPEMERIARFSGRAPDYKLLAYSHKEEFETQYRLAATLRGHTLIGVSCYCVLDMQAQLEGQGIDFALIRPSQQNIQKAILSAKSIVESKGREELKAQRMKSIVDYSAQGIVSIDGQRRVTSFNPAAERILDLRAGAVLSRRLDEKTMPAALRVLHGDGDFQLNQLVKLDGDDLLVNRIPVRANDRLEETIVSFQRVTDIQRLEIKARMQLLSKGLVAKHRFEDIVGTSAALRTAIDRARRFAETSASVLIEGETGTGKELFVQSIHNASDRRDGPFVAINCAALPETLLESELFGYADGAFTGAKRGGKAGLFELAHNGTIFLDEIGEVSPAIQSRLLRVLQEREILRVGGDRVIKVNVRVLSATNKNLYQMVREGQFRDDLFFRLGVLNLRLPPLRERTEDIRPLADRFVRMASETAGKRLDDLSADDIRMLQRYAWPGNVRELEYFLEKLAILADASVRTSDLIGLLLGEHTRDHGRDAVSSRPLLAATDDDDDRLTLEVGPMRDMQRQIVERMLERTKGNKVEVARRLGISRVTVWNKMKEADAGARDAQALRADGPFARAAAVRFRP
ncbi:sigma 54-interacting transcriptional regulator [Rhodoplanes elegans]|nr:sigma 54-interacting transcriptional regulator [Rhodoplanes elegans]